MTRRLILLHISDSHAAHRLGLMNPLVGWEDIDPLGRAYYYRPTPTEFQTWLWDDVYIPAIEKAVDLAAGDEIAVIHTGDQTHGKAHPEEIVGTRDADQITIACWNWKPILQLPNVVNVRFAFSTGAHSFGEGSADVLIANQLRAQYPNNDLRVVQHGLATINDVPVDYAHHGPGAGSRNWLKGNTARYYLRSLMMDDLMNGSRPPTLVLRAHYHDPIWETVRIWHCGELITSHIVIAPPLCGLSYWTHQAVKSPPIIRAGVMAYEFIDGRLVEFHPFVHTLDIRTKEVL